MLRGVHSWLALLAWTAEAPASDPSQEHGIEIEWPRRPECPSADALRSDVERRLGRPLGDFVGRDIRATAEIEPTEAGWRLRLHLLQAGVGGTRALEAETCALLARATALLLALAIDPVALARAEAMPTDEAVEPPEPSPPSDPPATREAHPEPAPNRPSSSEPPLRPPTRAKPERSRVRGFVAPGGFVAAGMLPGVGGGVQLSTGVLAPRSRFAVSGRFFPERKQALPIDPSAGVAVRAWTVAAQGCFRSTPAKALELPVCAQIEAGQLSGRGFGVRQSRTESAAWVAAGLGPGLAWVPVHWLSIEIDLAAIFRITRPVFALANVGDVHRPALVGLRATLGVAFRFPQ